ncbi:MAG: S8 family serine peptidase [Saprospiraceae bacterium]|nr:S8 family serine peptidase [Saprospiraceae bacterium]
MQKLIILFALLCLCSQQSLYSQRTNKYWIEFSDKNNSPYCTCRPAEFLSARALERRALANIEVVENDLPVNPDYLKQLKINGVEIHNSSRWLNSAAVMADSASAEQLKTLPFVRSVSYLGPHLKYRNPPNRPLKSRAPLKSNPAILGDDIPIWGYASQQNQLLGLPILHLAGHRGKDIWVAVMDGGFTNADTIPMFDSVGLQGRLFPGWDFVERDAGVFEGAQHGTSVLSVMAADLPGYFVGTAPDATYFLLKTEDTGGEFPIEEVNWVAGAEWADSLGVDIINASLGYTSFNDNLLSHTFSDLDGRTAIGSKGAAIAATKGMIICNSAGNEGDGTWRYIGVPADAPGLIAVGAVGSSSDRNTGNGTERALFSSFGPSADGRIKPDLVAPGDQIVVAGNVGIALGLSSGTSLASPMLAGALASLWSAFPEKTAAEILDAVYASADQHEKPDNARGYGLPEIANAWIDLGKMVGGNGGMFGFNSIGGELTFTYANDFFKPGDSVELRNIFGQKTAGIVAEIFPNEVSTLKISGLGDLPAGHYQIILTSQKGTNRLGAAAWR